MRASGFAVTGAFIVPVLCSGAVAEGCFVLGASVDAGMPDTNPLMPWGGRTRHSRLELLVELAVSSQPTVLETDDAALARDDHKHGNCSLFGMYDKRSGLVNREYPLMSRTIYASRANWSDGAIRHIAYPVGADARRSMATGEQYSHWPLASGLNAELWDPATYFLLASGAEMATILVTISLDRNLGLVGLRDGGGSSLATVSDASERWGIYHRTDTYKRKRSPFRKQTVPEELNKSVGSAESALFVFGLERVRGIIGEWANVHMPVECGLRGTWGIGRYIAVATSLSILPPPVVELLLALSIDLPSETGGDVGVVCTVNETDNGAGRIRVTNHKEYSWRAPRVDTNELPGADGRFINAPNALVSRQLVYDTAWNVMTDPLLVLVQLGGRMVDMLFKYDWATARGGEIERVRNATATSKGNYQRIPWRASMRKEFLATVDKTKGMAAPMIPLAFNSGSVRSGYDGGETVDLRARAADGRSVLRLAEPKSDMLVWPTFPEASPDRGSRPCVPEPRALAFLLVGVVANLVRQGCGRRPEHVRTG